MNTKISVIMSVYNEEERLVKEAIESILNQTYKNIEYIIILDNPDNIALRQLLQKYEEYDDRIMLHINNMNIGLVKSLNIALTYCSGCYIARMDADDISLPNRIENQKMYLESAGYDFIFSNVKYINEEGKIFAESSERELSENQLRRILTNVNISNHPTWFLKKVVYDTLQGYREIPYCEDYDFTLRSLHEGFSIGKYNESVLLYRVRTNSISRINSLNQFLNMKGLAKLFRKKKINNTNSLSNMIIKSKRESCENEILKYKQATQFFKTGLDSFQTNYKLRGITYIVKSILTSKFYAGKIFILFKHKLYLVIK